MAVEEAWGRLALYTYTFILLDSRFGKQKIFSNSISAEWSCDPVLANEILQNFSVDNLTSKETDNISLGKYFWPSSLFWLGTQVGKKMLQQEDIKSMFP